MKSIWEPVVIIVLMLVYATACHFTPTVAPSTRKVSIARQANHRFSLRTLFIVTTVAAIVLTLGVWATR